MNKLRALRAKRGLQVAAMVLFGASMAVFLAAFPRFEALNSQGAYTQDGYLTYMETQETILVGALTDQLGWQYIDAWQMGQEEDFAPDTDPNFFYKIKDRDTGEVLASSEVLGDYREKTEQVFNGSSEEESVTVTETYDTYNQRKIAVETLKANHPEAAVRYLDTSEGYWMSATYTASRSIGITVTGFLRYELEPNGYVWQELTEAREAVAVKDPVLIAVTLGGLLALLSFAWATWSAGWKEGEDRPVRNEFELHWLAALVLGAAAALGGAAAAWNQDLVAYILQGGTTLSTTLLAAVMLGVCFLCALVGLWCWLTLVRRWKTREQGQERMKGWARGQWSWMKDRFRWLADNLAHFWVLVAIVIALAGLEFLCIVAGAAPLWLLLKIPEVALVIYVSVALTRLKKGGQEIADGNVNYQIPLDDLKGDFRAHGEHLNSIREAIQAAVEDQMKSERMKTELITNVSHDIKTPLTSIVNYVDLLKKQEMPTKEAKEYLEVLDRQAAKLKKLTEDLVEAAKATAGTTKVDLQPTDVNVLLTQSAGEYQERLQSRNLDLILTPDPDHPAILADGRQLWRVFENLLSNVHKYAQPGTRVYLTCQADAKMVTVTFRNISATPLNISADELLERFVRGDDARHTEGSGLGLSIARSLTQLQHGTFDLSIDGDLFKAILTFPRLEG